MTCIKKGKMLGSNKKNKPKLGDILIERGFITNSQLTEALEIQKEAGGFVGEILIKLEYVRESQIVSALMVQCDIPYISLDKYEIDKEVLHLLPEEFVVENNVLPIDKVADAVTVAMSDPLNDKLIEQVKEMTGCHVMAFIALKSELEQQIIKSYSKEE